MRSGIFGRRQQPFVSALPQDETIGPFSPVFFPDSLDNLAIGRYREYCR